MNIINRPLKSILLALTAISLVFAACNKPEHPALGDYPEDSNPPGGPLKFYAAYEGINVDSIRANYGTDNSITYGPGPRGDAMQGGPAGHVIYPSANDFKNSTSFTVAFWIKKNGPSPAGGGSSFAFGLSTTTDIWTGMDMFLEFEDAGNPSSADSAGCKFYVLDQWFEFIRNPAANKYDRLPKVLDGQWHHLVFTLDGAAKKFTPYIDGAAYTALTPGFNNFSANGGVLDLSKASGLVVGGPGQYSAGVTPESWMGNFNGDIDQFRLYDKALSASEITDLYNSEK